jgi:ElaB/YqjD/DUF883 family membrane-anchored ribosome-binding protein
MNFSRTDSGVLFANRSTKNLISNRFVVAMLATFAAFSISLLGSNQWASADSGTTIPESEQIPGSPVDVKARAGDQVAAVSWLPAELSVRADGYVVTSSPSDIVVEADADEFLVRVPGLENGVEYTFTVVAFNENVRSDPSEPSNAVTPSEGNDLNDEELRRLHERLREKAAEARKRFEQASERAREKLESTQDRVGEHLDKQTDRAREFVDKTRELADRRNDKQSEQARNWYDRLKDQLAKRLERAVGTPRYEELHDRAADKLEEAGEKLADRLDNSRENSDARVEKAEEKARDRVEKSTERAENVLERTEERLTDRVSNMRDRLHELILRLRKIWSERSNAEA